MTAHSIRPQQDCSTPISIGVIERLSRLLKSGEETTKTQRTQRIFSDLFFVLFVSLWFYLSSFCFFRRAHSCRFSRMNSPISSKSTEDLHQKALKGSLSTLSS